MSTAFDAFCGWWARMPWTSPRLKNVAKEAWLQAWIEKSTKTTEQLESANAEVARLRKALNNVVRLAIVDKSCSLEAQGYDQLDIERYSGHEDAAKIAREALAKGE